MFRCLFPLVFFFSAIGLSAAERIEIPLGQRKVVFQKRENPETNASVRTVGPILIALHSNESTSIRVAKALLSQHSGTLIELESGGQRRLSLRPGSTRVTIDPNRVFSLDGVIRDLRRFSIFSEAEARQCAKFGEEIIRTFKIDGMRPIVALHNNTNGGFSIDSYLEGGSEASAAAKVTRGPVDPDNFFLVTHPKLYEDLARLDFNVVLQDNRNAPDDGSLSVYCGRRGIIYVNVEAQHGAEAEQKRMLDLVLKLLGTKTSATF